jgi:rRNA maturation endonuclease Nob1
MRSTAELSSAPPAGDSRTFSNASNQEATMSSRGKKKITMAKLNREARLRERRVEKKARKEARRDAAATQPQDDLSQTEGHDLAETEPLVRTGEGSGLS